MKRMKLSAFLIICILSLIAAHAEVNNSTILEQGVGCVSGNARFNSEAVVGNLIYTLDYVTALIYQYSMDDGTSKGVSALIPLESDDNMLRVRVPVILTGDGTNIYSIEATQSYTDTGSITEDLGFYRLTIGETVSDEKICALDFGNEIMSMELGDLYNAIESVAYENGALFVAFDSSEPAAMAVDTSSGEVTSLDLPGIREFAILDESHVLAACHPGSVDETYLYFIDPVTLQADQKSAIPDDSGEAYGFAYHEKALYFMRNGAIWKLSSLDGKSATLVTSIPGQTWRAIASESGVYIAGGSYQVTMRDLNQAEEPVVLTYHGDFFPWSNADAYLATHPNIALTNVQYTTSNEIISSLLTRSSEPDIFFLHTGMSSIFASMRNRGYCAPLNGEAISQTVAEMYPGVAEFVTHKGAVVALPISIVEQYRMGIDLTIWHAMGLQDDDIPLTWVEFLSFLRDTWPDLAARYPEYTLSYDEDNGRNLIFYWIMNDYNDYRVSGIEDPGYDTPEFRAVMEAFLNVDFASLPNDISLSQGSYLFNTRYDVSPRNPDKSESMFTYMPLTFFDAQESAGSMALMLVVLNPYSEHKEEALGIIEYLAANMNPVERIALFPGANEPVESAEYATYLQQYNDQLAVYEKAIDEETDAEKAEALNQEMSAYRDETGEWLESIRWAATEESIARYRTSIKDIVPACAYTVNEADMEAQSKLFEQFYAGNVDLDKFISELNRMLYMNQLEDQ